ncbi:GGDEF domain-containing protein [Dickeya dianthicola]|uniref:diguanylate cyclase n=2 Tax=Dickeya dianthicola TaxID=204039 RepID=A0ABX9NIJ1_9GAMM|nr:sensor domain-containing diguanylate cyclase [Dickeya dianthicola]MCI4117337.1 sensor domain-containing diguanylate cyclase [Dickeya dianthicola]MCI4124719.1 sensor domain-containing diguanylate cyclase [Dickeya dianthicola]MZG33632.1 diguanylate cyclase [Dickeya dianthicola]RJL65606.1 GGDEF domain-containing protein [Dickeya dianthicola]RJL70916.1 GGDEF domain-containing protein [Dickeya dianthicola]
MRIKKLLQINLLHLILFISLASMLVTLLNSYFTFYHVQKKLLFEQANKVNSSYSSKLSTTVDNFFSISEQQLSYSARLIASHIQSGNIRSLQVELQRIHELSHAFNSMVVVTGKGQIIAASPISLNLTGITLTSNQHLTTLREKRFFISSPYTSLSGNYIIFISQPILDDAGNYLGYIGGSLYLNSRRILNEFMNTQFSNDSFNTYVIDKEGTIIYHHDTSQIGRKLNDSHILNSITNQNKGSFMMPDEQGIPSPASFIRTQKADWIIITQQSFHSIEEALNDVMLSVLRQGTPLGIVALLALSILAYYISKPLRQLAKSASSMEQLGVIGKIRSVKAWYLEVEQLKRVLLMGTVLLHKRIGRLSSEAHTDPLSGMLNRRGMQESMEEIRNEYKKVSVIAIDIDHFKVINDSFGHDVGDEVIRKLSQQIRKNFRKNDLVCRIGGEEFLILLPGADIHVATVIAERLRNNVANTVYMPGSRHHQVTISIGVTTFNPQKSALDIAIKTADNALYKAKNGGRNQVVVEYLSDDISLAQH